LPALPLDGENNRWMCHTKNNGLLAK
jgi:hypothetical protein